MPIPWDKIADCLFNYGPMGVITFMFLVNNQRVYNNMITQFNSSRAELQKVQETREKIFEASLATLRTGQESHNQKTIELLSGIGNQIGAITNCNQDNFDELHTIIHDVNSLVDELRTVTTEIKFVCPSRSKHQLGEILIENGFVKNEDLQTAIKIQKEMNQK